MPKKFTKNERRISDLFTKNSVVTYKGEEYIVVFTAKPQWKGRGGEPKTDIFIRTVKKEHPKENVDFKISYKKNDAQFVENKMGAERAQQIFGDQWMEVVKQKTNSIKEEFLKRKLIYKNKYSHTNAGSITLGWKFELMRSKSGYLSEKIELTREQIVDAYLGTGLGEDKKNATVKGKVVQNSGVAEYIFEERTEVTSAQEVMDNLQTIDEYLEQYPELFFACKALNYRTFTEKHDGDRPLSVYVDWEVENGKLRATLKFDQPLVTKGNAICAKLKLAMKTLGISNTDDISLELVENNGIIV